MLFSSIGTEKENRTLELLLLSISPRQLLAGKTAALGMAGLAQTAVWLGTVYTMTTFNGAILDLPPGFTFPLDILVWCVVFFLGGFGLYASLMAGAGAMVPNMKEAGIANFIAMAPLLIAYIIGLIAPMAEATGTIVMVVLSLFPFTAPVIMVMRLTDGTVPVWQLLLSAGLLFATAYAVLNAVSAMFHAQNLLSGQPFSVRRYLRAMTGRA
jgi:ABC-2 type transport system permease protein